MANKLPNKETRAKNWGKATEGMSKKEQVLLGPKVVGKLAKAAVKKVTSSKKGK